MSAKVAVIRFPGSNCESETLRALERCGLTAELVRWNAPPEVVAGFQAYVLPGGFSYQDRIRAGAVAARLPLLDVIAQRSADGAPLLGICNGAQILVEAGLVGPAAPVAGAAGAALAHNRIPRRDGYYTRWVFLAPGPAARACLFTRDLTEPVPMPMAHGEGRFLVAPAEQEKEFGRHIALAYADAAGAPARGFPENPNGSLLGAAGVTNDRGNVLALMPHPERAQLLAQVPEDLPGPWGKARRGAHESPSATMVRSDQQPASGSPRASVAPREPSPGRAADLESPGPGLALFAALARHLGGKGGR